MNSRLGAASRADVPPFHIMDLLVAANARRASHGDLVMARPGYACYRNVLRALGVEVVEIDCGPDTRFRRPSSSSPPYPVGCTASSSPHRRIPPGRCCCPPRWLPSRAGPRRTASGW